MFFRKIQKNTNKKISQKEIIFDEKVIYLRVVAREWTISSNLECVSEVVGSKSDQSILGSSAERGSHMGCRVVVTEGCRFPLTCIGSEKRIGVYVCWPPPAVEEWAGSAKNIVDLVWNFLDFIQG